MSWLLAGLMVAGSAFAGGFRDAPGTARDPGVDNADLYAFVSPEPERSDRLVIIANWIPLQRRESGPTFWGFDDDALYQIHVDSDGDANEDVTYQFRFTTTRASVDTYQYNTGPIGTLGDAALNVRQAYELVRIKRGVREVLGRDLPVAPPHIGSTSIAHYSPLREAAITTLADTVRVFVGPRAEGSFGDLGALYDLLQISTVNPRPSVDASRGANVHSIALEIPKVQLTSTGTTPATPADTGAVLGVWATTLRRQVTLRRPGGQQVSRGPFVQVSRVGMPLVNEVFVPWRDKDRFNASHPRSDAQFAKYFEDPELPRLFAGLFGMTVPAAPRADVASIYLTGVPALTQVTGAKPAEMLRVNVAVRPASKPDRMGHLGGDDAGFPNGRRPCDDVVDITLRVAAGVRVTGFDIEPNNALADGVGSPSEPLLETFPFLADPHSARDNDALVPR